MRGHLPAGRAGGKLVHLPPAGALQKKVIVTSKIHTKAAYSAQGKKKQNKSNDRKVFMTGTDNSMPTSEPKALLADAEGFPGGLLRCVEINATNR